jgi:lysophospholipase L1-like esterase
LNLARPAARRELLAFPPRKNSGTFGSEFASQPSRFNSLVDETQVMDMPRNVRVLFVGDSVTAGFGLGGGLSYVCLANERLRERGVQAEILCNALDGADSGYLLRRYHRMVTAHDPDWVVFNVGLNDALPPEGRAARGPAEYAANMLELIDRTTTLGARPLLVVPNPRFPQPAALRLAGYSFDAVDCNKVGCDDATVSPKDVMPQYADVVRGLADALHLPLVDAHRAFLAEPDMPRLLQDGTHPTPAGHELLADLVTEELLQVLGGDAATFLTARR